MIVALFIIGLFLGSFINVIAWRYEKSGQLFTKDVISGRSQCPSCQHILRWPDLIPLLSFIFLKGHCRYCQAKISWRYPLVEIITGLILALLYLKLSSLYAFP